MLVVCEDVVLCKPEPGLDQPGQPAQKFVAASNVAGSRVATRNVPDDILVQERTETCKVPGSECIRGAPVRCCVRMLIGGGHLRSPQSLTRRTANPS